MTNRIIAGHCRHCRIYQKDLFKHLRQNPKHKSNKPRDKSNYRAYHRGKDYRTEKAKFQKKRYKRKHPKRMKLKDFF